MAARPSWRSRRRGSSRSAAQAGLGCSACGAVTGWWRCSAPVQSGGRAVRGDLDGIRTAAERGGNGVVAVWLYGSAARGKDRAASDVEIAVVAEGRTLPQVEEAMREALRDAEDALAFAASVLAVDVDDVRAPRPRERPLVGNGGAGRPAGRRRFAQQVAGRQIRRPRQSAGPWRRREASTGCFWATAGRSPRRTACAGSLARKTPPSTEPASRAGRKPSGCSATSPSGPIAS
jgi:predicted nucleotidyltransferase